MKISPRLAVTLTFIAFGMVMGGQIGAIPALKAQAGLNELLFGVVAMLSTIANILGLSLGGFWNKRFDHRTMLLFIIPANLAGFALTLTAQSVAVCAVTWMLFNFCVGTMDLFMNAEAGVVEHDLKKPVFSSFHAAVLYAIGASGFLSGYIAQHFGLFYCIIPTLPFAALALFAVHKAIPHHAIHSDKEARPAAPLPVKILVLIGIILGLDVAAELTCIQWSGQLLNAMRPDLAAYSGLGVGFYGLCSGTVRVFGDRVRARFSDLSLVAVSLFVGFAGFAILFFQPNFTLTVLAFAITGCGLGLVFPCMFSIAARLAPNARAAALGLASMVSGPPRILLPLMLGWIAQTSGLGSIYVAAAVAMLVALAFVGWTARAISAKTA